MKFSQAIFTAFEIFVWQAEGRNFSEKIVGLPQKCSVY
jgi:hypothetical protein